MNIDREDHHEQLSDGVANIVHDESQDRPVARIVPVEVGEHVTGHRGDGAENAPSIWDREPLREAFEEGALSDLEGNPTRVVLGEGGENPHYPITAQVPGDRILGEVEQWEWEEDVGPVGYAPLVDEGIAERIDMGLLELSADWLRFLEEYDRDRGGHPVEQIVALPRVTLLERGAADGASISITEGMAEALAYNPEAGGAVTSEMVEQMADATISEPDYSGTSTASWDAPTLEDTYDGDLDTAQNAAIVEFRPVESFGDDLALWVLDGEGQLNRNALESAYDLAPQVDGLSEDGAGRARSTILSLANAEWDDHDVGPDEEQQAALEQLAVGVGDAVRWQSSAGGTREPSGERYGVVANPLEDADEADVLVEVHQPNAAFDGWETRNERHRMVAGTLERIGPNGVNSLPSVTDAIDSEQNAPGEDAGDRSLLGRLAAPVLKRLGWIDESTEQLAQLYTLRFVSYDSFVDQEYVDEAVSALVSIDGVGASATESAEQPEIVAVIDTEAADLNTLNEDLMAALEDSPFAVFEDFDWLEAAAYEGLAETDGDSTLTVDERADTRAGRVNPDQSSTGGGAEPGGDAPPDTPLMSDKNQLVEQLADARTRAQTAENEKENLEEQLSERESRIEDLENEVDDLESKKEQLSEEVSELEEATNGDDVESLKEMLGEIVLGPESMMTPEQIAEQHTAGELLSMISENAEDEDASPVEIVREQMGATPAPNGQGAPEGEPGQNLTDEELEQANEIAVGAMGSEQVRQASKEQMSYRAFAKERMGVDPAQCDTPEEFRQKVEAQRGEA
ncbi:hypothetical protein [Saliphagus sp. LR7]|uniref:hypothetical protein n=1 Tax=Saliphagus sp. LR7 TaxID=2282654 RepID=UPI000DF7B138|nr:hypothetical protein [Saliphagus sp. LR7]